MSELRQHLTEIVTHTRGRALIDITGEVRSAVAESGVREGLATLFIRHTSASLIVQENADPDVQADLIDALDRLAPEGAGWRHGCEGPDDMPAHIKSALTHTSLAIPVMGGAPALGTWQGVYIAEHRARGHSRTVAVHVIGA